MAVKCKIKMGDKVLPVDGTVVQASSGGGTGTCPECDTPGVLLSIVGGFVRAHVIAEREIPENNPQPPTLVVKGKKIGKGLSEPITDLTDTGVRIGDPRAAEQRRVAQVEGAAGIGTVQVSRRVPTGDKLKSGAPKMTRKMITVPGTEENVREALDYWRNRKITDRTSDAIRVKKNDMITSLSRRLEAIMGAQTVAYNERTRSLDVTGTAPVARQPELRAQPDTAQAHRGPTLVRGRDETPRERPADLPWSESTDLRRDGTVRKSTSFERPLGRERFDRRITDVPEPVAPLSRGAKRRNRRRLLERSNAAQSASQRS